MTETVDTFDFVSLILGDASFYSLGYTLDHEKSEHDTRVKSRRHRRSVARHSFGV